MIKIFLTGDNHIGLSYSRYSDKAEDLAECRISAFQGMAECAVKEQCDIFAITGDLFNSHSVGSSEIEKLIKCLSVFHGKVLIIPGNHDYCSDEIDLWREFEEKASGRLDCLVMTEYRPFNLKIRDESVIIFPAFCKSEHSEPGRNNLGWIREYFSENLSNNAYKIGMAHGAIQGVSPDRDKIYFMMTRDELNNIPVDVWLIGHTHVPYPNSLSTEFETISNNKIFNAGSHMQTDVADKNSEGQCFIIELNKFNDKKIIRAKKFLSGPVRFYRLEINVSGQDLSMVLDDELRNIQDNSVVELILTGFLRNEDFANRDNIIHDFLGRFIGTKYDERGVIQIVDDKMIKEFPENSFNYKFLANIINQENYSREEAYMAYSLIKSL